MKTESPLRSQADAINGYGKLESLRAPEAILTEKVASTASRVTIRSGSRYTHGEALPPAPPRTGSELAL